MRRRFIVDLRALRLFVVRVVLASLLVACGRAEAELLPTPTLTPLGAALRMAPPAPVPVTLIAPTATATLPAAPAVPTVTPTPAPTATPVPDWYRVRAGDSLLSIAIAHDLDLEALLALNGLSETATLSIGQPLVVPSHITVNLPAAYLAHDSEVVYGPSYLTWDTRGWVAAQGGFLASYQEREKSGAEIVEEVAAKWHVGPRVLLAAMELASGWVSSAEPRSLYAFGLEDPGRPDLRAQASWAARKLMEGYYGQLEGRRDWVTLRNSVDARLFPDTNAGTAAVANWLAATADPLAFPNFLQSGQWQQTYERLFGTVEGGRVRPPDGTQPFFALPWPDEERWFFTGAAHGGYGDRDSGWAALDFAAPEPSGCRPSPYAVHAIAPGLVIGSAQGETWIDMDADGDIRTGWVLLYMHLATDGRIPQGAMVRAGDVLGYPSCEGGIASGAHVHIARMYHGQWMPTVGAVPFQLGDWVAHSATGVSYEGTLRNLKSNQRLDACDCRDSGFNQFPGPYRPPVPQQLGE